MTLRSLLPKTSLISLLSLNLICSTHAREWTTADNKAVEAEFIGQFPGQTVLQTKDGKLLKIPTAKLSKNDALHIKGLEQLPTFADTHMAMRFHKNHRLLSLAKFGGTAACEEAVVKSLQWFKKTQNRDGSWCNNKQVGMTGLALLCLLGHGETPKSIEFGETVEKAISYLIKTSEKKSYGGKLSMDLADRHWVYEHTIATYVLAEAYAACKLHKFEVPKLEEALEKALAIIVDGQNKAGGWTYSFELNTRKDTSLTTWCVQALYAGLRAGIEFKGIANALKKPHALFKACQSPEGGVGYLSASGKITMTGGALLCLQQTGKDNTKEATKALEWITKNVDFKFNEKSADLYAHRHYGQAMFNAGGKSWSHYNNLFRDELLSGQRADGAFNIPAGGAPHAIAPVYVGNSGHGKHYRTALCCLMLEVYYRDIPVKKAK